jgi:hypothetical protein
MGNEITYPCSDFTEEEKAEYRKDLLEVKAIMDKGHPHHCACRQVWGDGECECSLYKEGYDPYVRMIKKADGES